MLPMLSQQLCMLEYRQVQLIA